MLRKEEKKSLLLERYVRDHLIMIIMQGSVVWYDFSKKETYQIARVGWEFCLTVGRRLRHVT